MADDREVDYRGLAQYLISNAGENPDDVWSGVDKRAAAQRRSTVLESQRRGGRSLGGRESDPQSEEGLKAAKHTFVPQSPLDVALYALPLLRAAKIGAAGVGVGGALTGSDAQAGPGSAAEKALRAAGRFVTNPERVLKPGIYQNPRQLAAQAAERVAPEHEALKQLFGVSRGDLYEIGGRGTRQGNIDPVLFDPVKNPKGSYAADAVMNPRNAQRQIDALAEAERFPGLIHGPDSWYVMDPMYQRMVQLVGPERAKAEYQKFNTVVPMFSPGSDVLTEINRGTGANMMITRGEWPAFLKYAGMREKDRGRGFPEALRDVQGHPFHKTSQAGSVERSYIGDAPMMDPKVPLYIQASGVPETGFQTKLPVPDAHYTRSVGMSDVRKNANPGESMSMSEYREVGPWYRENVASPLGIEAVPAQARQWTLYGPQTGVDTPLGAPKLEILAQKIWERAAKLGIDPRTLRDDVLTGKAHASWLLPALAPVGMMAAGMGGQSGAADQL